MDKDAEQWKKAIKTDKLVWTQVSNLKEWQDPIAASYHVEQLPSTFLVDKNGVLIAIDLHGQQLAAKIKELLSK